MAAHGSLQARAGVPLLPAIAGLGLLAAMFLLSWFGAGAALERGFEEAREIQQQFGGPDVVVPDVEENAWEAFGFTRFVLLAAALSGLVLTAVRLSDRPAVSKLRFAAVTTALGTLATALVLYHVVNPPGDSSRELGVFAGLLASGALALGGWRALEVEERRAHPRLERGSGSASREAPPPARARSSTRTRSRSSSD